MSSRCFNMTWTSSAYPLVNAYLGIAIPAFLFHVCFWFQVATHRSLRQRSMLWVYNYLLTDIILLVQLFLEYILRRSLPYCISPAIFQFLCNIEAYTSAYMVLLEAYMLVCLNISRYWLIVKNYDASARYPNTVLLFNLFLYLFGIVIYVLQVEAFEIVTVHPHESTLSCHLQFTDLTTQLVNLLFVLFIPIILNCYFMGLTTMHVRRSQQAVRAQVYLRKNKTGRMLAFFLFSISSEVSMCNCWYNSLSSTRYG
jgi:hypothetical protein